MTAASPDRLDRIESTLETVLETIQKLDADVRAANERTDTYWEASKLLINLAFGLIATAVIAIIVPAVLS